MSAGGEGTARNAAPVEGESRLEPTAGAGARPGDPSPPREASSEAARPVEPVPPPSEGGPRVALVHDWLTGMRGGEKVLEEIHHLFPEAPIYTLFHHPGSVSPLLESHPIETSFLQRAPGARRHYRRYLPLFPLAVEGFDLSGYDLVVSTSHAVAKGAIPAPGAWHLCYCHTPMRYAWDQEHAYFRRPAGRLGGPGGLVRSSVLAALRAWDAASAPRVDLFVANSSFVARRIRRYYGREAEVLAPPVDVDFFTPGEGGASADTPYLLMVTALNPYKRVDLAIAAAERLGLELRVVGFGPARRELERLAGGRTRFLGRVGGDELRELYRGALCLLQPGIEDFGIASVEALACGTPVVALGRGGVLDIVRDGIEGVLYEPPDDAGAVAAAVDKARQVRFNSLDLRRRSEAFSRARFVRGLRSLLAPRLPDRRDVP